jgi:putative phosphoribosyl transferase
MFQDRSDAGRQLAQALRRLSPIDPVVLALPRGGVPVAVEVARALDAPLDLLFVRKIGAAYQPELALAAVAEGGGISVNDEMVDPGDTTTCAYIDREAQRQLQEIARRRQLYLGGRPPVPVAGRTAIVVDDGIATGATVRAALELLRQKRPARIVLAVPVAPRRSLSEMRAFADEIVCLETPAVFEAVGRHYRHFGQVEDEEVVALLAATSPGSRSP